MASKTASSGVRGTFMPGTDKTGEYIVLGHTGRGRIGVRVLDVNVNSVTEVRKARVRVEPIRAPLMVDKMAQALSRHLGWKQPFDDDQYRFSLTAYTEDSIKDAVVQGLAALGVEGGLVFTQNGKAPKWMKTLVKAVKDGKFKKKAKPAAVAEAHAPEDDMSDKAAVG